eukprot:jgi/Mesvir1/10784/Mv13840-RA.1
MKYFGSSNQTGADEQGHLMEEQAMDGVRSEEGLRIVPAGDHEITEGKASVGGVAGRMVDEAADVQSNTGIFTQQSLFLAPGNKEHATPQTIRAVSISGSRAVDKGGAERAAPGAGASSNKAVCSPGAAQAQARRFSQANAQDGGRWAACASSAPVLERVAAASPAHAKLLLDAGTGLGYSALQLLGPWAPHPGLTPAALGVYLEEQGVADACGSCQQCKRALNATGAQVPPGGGQAVDGFPSLHVFEPDEASVGRFQGFLRQAQRQGPASVRGAIDAIQLHSRALLAAASPAASLDAFMDDVASKGAPRRIDVLHVDTRGTESSIIMGGKKLLADGQVGVLLFRYGAFGEWKKRGLQGLVKWLAQGGYACYMLGGQGKLARLDAGCWDEVYEKVQDAMVACVQQRGAPAGLLSSLCALRLGPCPTGMSSTEIHPLDRLCAYIFNQDCGKLCELKTC